MAEEAKKKADAPADKAPKKEEPAKAGGHGGATEGKEKGGGGGLMTKMPVLLGGAMLLEAVVLFAGFKFLGGGAPRAAAGAEIVTAETPAAEAAPAEGAKGEGAAAEGGAKPAAKIDGKKIVEIPVLGTKDAPFRALNRQNGRMFFYDVSIYVDVKAEHEDHVKDVIQDRGALIQDRVRTIIAQCDPDKLGGGSEPGLETLRRQVKYQLDEIVGEGIIDEVLVPKCIPFRADY
jgi:flagellar basal body-associated protein FliL